MKNEDVEFLRNFSIDVVSSNKHNKEDAAKLLSDVNTFTTEWKEFKDILQSKVLRYAYTLFVSYRYTFSHYDNFIHLANHGLLKVHIKCT